MRILFVNHKLGYFGGVEQNVADVARGLTTRGHACYLAHGAASGRDCDDYARAFAAVSPCSEAGAPPGKDFRAIVREIAPDVVYVHKVDSIAPFLEGRASTKIVRMVHDYDIVCPRRHKYFALSGSICDRPAGWRCWLDAAFIERTGGKIRFANIADKIAELNRNKALDHLIVGSAFMERSLVMNGFPAARISRVPPAVDETPVLQVPVPSDPILLFVGQLIKGKGVDLLLDAVAAIEGPIRVVIAGDGNARGQLEAQARRCGIEDKVVFRGWVDHNEIGHLYDEARAVVVPSRWPEPFGMVGPEAMRHGRAVVAFDAGGIRDWLRHEQTGVLVPAGDAHALARAVTRVLREPGLAETFGAAGVGSARSFYGFEHQLDQIEAALQPTPEPAVSRTQRREPCESV